MGSKCLNSSEMSSSAGDKLLSEWRRIICSVADVLRQDKANIFRDLLFFPPSRFKYYLVTKMSVELLP